MAPSYRAINYSLRPAKAIERKMLCEAFLRLHPFERIESYQYVGFGSIYFSDFQLFHRWLGINNMLSIEKDAYAKECFEFNKPYSCIRLDFRSSTDVLPELDWSPRTIAWLDYDGKLDNAALSDIASVSARAPSGSVLVVSVNVQVEHDPDPDTRKRYSEETGLAFSVDEYRLWELRNRIGDAVPPEITGRDLRGTGLASVCRKVIDSRIREALSSRNSAGPAHLKMSYSQIVHFIYSDGAIMLTVGGVFVSADEEYKLTACGFNDLPFVRSAETPYKIVVPCLTLKEMRHLNAQLPFRPDQPSPPPGVPATDTQRYTELYRYFPTFAEAILT